MKQWKAKTPRTKREKAVSLTRGLLGDDKVTAFLRQCGKTDADILACELINRELDAGGDLDTVFYTGRADGFYLNAKALESNAFEISFSCVARHLGDGGTWLVVFEADGSVQRITSEGRWIA